MLARFLIGLALGAVACGGGGAPPSAADRPTAELPSGPHERFRRVVVRADLPPVGPRDIAGVLFDRAGVPLGDVALGLRRIDSASAACWHPGVGRSLGVVGMLQLRSLAPDEPAQLALPSKRAWTDAEGRFRFAGPPDGAFEIVLLEPKGGDHGGGASLTGRPVAAGARDVVLHIDREWVDVQRACFVETPSDEPHDGPRGRLSVTARFPDGTPYDLDNRVWIRRVEDGAVVRHTARYHDRPWTQYELPAGRYVVAASPRENVPWCGSGWTPVLTPLAGAEREVTVPADGSAEVELVFSRGGRVRLALEVDRPSTDSLIREAFDRLPGIASNEFGAALEGPGAGRARLVADDGDVVDLTFFAPELLASYRYGTILPGTSCLSDTIAPAGAYRLEVVVPGYAPTATRVELVDDEVAEVRISLVSAR